MQIVCDRKVNERFLGKNFVNSKNSSIFALAFGKGALLYISKAHFYQGPIRLSARTQDFHSWKRSSILLWATNATDFFCRIFLFRYVVSFFWWELPRYSKNQRELSFYTSDLPIKDYILFSTPSPYGHSPYLICDEQRERGVLTSATFTAGIFQPFRHYVTPPLYIA